MKGIPGKAELQAIVERLRSGQAALIKESNALGFSHNGPLRAALKDLLGVDGYNELMMGKRPAALNRTAEDGTVLPLVDDSDVPVIQRTPTKDGWKIRYKGVHGDVTVLLSPDGTAYEKAALNQHADLIVDLTDRGFGKSRWRRTEYEPPRRAKEVELDLTNPTDAKLAASALKAGVVQIKKKAPKKSRKPTTKKRTRK